MADKNKSKISRGLLIALMFPVLLALVVVIHSWCSPIIGKAVFENYCRQQNISQEDIQSVEYQKTGFFSLATYNVKVVYKDRPDTLYSYGFDFSGLWDDDITPFTTGSAHLENGR